MPANVTVPSGAIVAHVLTDGNVDDAPTGLALIGTVGGDISCVTANGAYDTVAIYEAAAGRDATVVVPPTKTAAVSWRRPRSSARDHTIMRVKKIGRRQWKKGSRYHIDHAYVLIFPIVRPSKPLAVSSTLADRSG